MSQPGYEDVTVTQRMTSACVHRWVIKDFNTHLSGYNGCMVSSTFCQPDDPRTSWKMMIYPNGTCEARGWVSLYLKLVSCSTRSVRVKAEFSVLRDDGARAAQTTTEAELRAQQPTCGFVKFMDKEQLLSAATSLLPSNVLTVMCRVTVLGELLHTTYRNDVAKTSKCGIRGDLSRLLSTGQFSDFIISVDNREYRVHKAILAARSPVFMAMLESPSKESLENKMTIEDLRPDVVEQMLAFMYSGTAPEIDSMAEELLRAADKYQLPFLKTICAQHMKSKLSVKTAADLLLLADTYSVPELKTSVLSFISVYGAEVVGTDGWRRLVKIRPDIIADASSSLVASKWERSS
ncbi:speckle-type POZ protein-like [Ornithodoros turicata]|uniref:speckle-type POZ protein-like n=1 Tax=Ornithodoros turicata TaxID=34597 RepID=UPI003139081E